MLEKNSYSITDLSKLIEGLSISFDKNRTLLLLALFLLTGCNSKSEIHSEDMCPGNRHATCLLKSDAEGNPSLFIGTRGEETVQFNFEEFKRRLEAALKLWLADHGIPEGYEPNFPQINLDHYCMPPADTLARCLVIKPRADFGGGLNLEMQPTNIGSFVKRENWFVLAKQRSYWQERQQGPGVAVFDGLFGKEFIPLEVLLAALGGGHPMDYLDLIAEAFKAAGLDMEEMGFNDYPLSPSATPIPTETPLPTATPDVSINIRPTTTPDSVPQTGHETERWFLVEVFENNKLVISLTFCTMLLTGMGVLVAKSVGR